ncbi:MAG: hypothetical protein IKA05_02315 [Clostridia bacterium]|nr:hypothetical protein [Clostridia bacterium]
MKYTKHYTVKWHDTDANRCMTPSHLLMYMEETSNHHLISAGMSLDELRDRRGLGFLLSRIAIRIYLPLFANDEIDVETWVCESRGLSFVRCFRVLRGGEVAAEAYSVWALMDLCAHKLLPVTAFPYDIEPELPLGAEVSARVRLPALAGMELVGERRIVYSDIDYNGHMNNTHYPNMLCDFTPSIRGLRVTGISLSFLHEAAYGHTLRVYRMEREGGGYFFRTLGEDGTTCLEAMLLTEPFTGVSSAHKSQETG